MIGRSVLWKARVGGFIMAGGLITGMSVLASEGKPHDTISPISQGIDVADPLGMASPGNLSRCTKTLKWGSLGAGLNCEGQERVQCGLDV
jgi:hypothetical protein